MHEFVLSPARAKPAKGVKLMADAKRELRMAAIASERRFSGSPDGSAVDSMFGGDEGEPTDTTLLESLDLASGSILRYDYDFGDDWQHAIALEKTLSTPDAEALIASTPDAAAVWKKFSATTRTPIAVCIAGARAGPIEDCGGPWGYMDVCAIMADPDHPDHAARKEWMEEYAASGDAKRVFDPERFEPLTINKLMAKHLKH